METDELCLDSVQKVIGNSKDNLHHWKRPGIFSYTGHVKPHEDS